MDAFTLDKIEFDAVRRILSRFCRCSLGEGAALSIAPSSRGPVVRRRLEQTSQMVEAVREVGLPPLGGVTDITAALKRAVPGHGAGAEDFAAIASTLDGAGNCRTFLLDLPEHLTHLRELAGELADFTREVQGIRAIVAPDGTIRDDASPRLAELRSNIAATTQQIHDVIHGYLRNPEVKKLLQSANVMLHGDRYVLPVKVDNRGRLPGVVHRASDTGATVFVEPNASVELNNRLVDLHDHERREIERLLSGLAVLINARADTIEKALHTLGQVDLLSAKAQYAYQFDMTCPEVTDRGVLEFFHAKHPLLMEATAKVDGTLSAGMDRGGKEHPPVPRKPEKIQVVPIDVRLGSDFDILVITGSNTGGKTVTLKTVALLVVMVQSGLHIPVRRGAKMPIFRDVLIEIGDEQSLEQSLSTFGGHVHRLKNIFNKARRDTLVLLDELGSGTDPDEGGAIGQAVLDELRRIGCMAMVTTHFSILKAYALNHERVDNASVEFDTKTLRPTYHLRIGTPGESHAITVAAKLGLNRRLVESARRHLGQRGGQFRKALRATGAARRDAETARAEAAAAQVHAEIRAEALQGKMADLERLKGEFAAWLGRLSELKGGDELFIPSANRTGRLVRLELHKQIALVDVDNIQQEVPLTDLIPDLGQDAVRRHVAALRKSTSDHAAHAAADRAEAQRLREEAQRLEKNHKERARQFDAWLGAIARIKVGDEVPISQKPGRGKVLSVDFTGLRVTVQADGKDLKLSLQDLFPQVGPFAVRAHPGPKGRERRGGGGKGQAPPQAANRPIPHRKPDSKAAKRNRAAILGTPPGEKVFVVPFNTAATLIRVNEEKNTAVVSRGAFEMQIPLADVEPMNKKAIGK